MATSFSSNLWLMLKKTLGLGAAQELNDKLNTLGVDGSGTFTTVTGTLITAPTINTSTGGGASGSTYVELNDDDTTAYVLIRGDTNTRRTISATATSITDTVTCATGEYTKTITANLADAWSITDGVGDLVTFETTTGARVITIGGGVAADSVDIGGVASAKVTFFAGTPVVRQDALTTQLTSITHTAPGTPDYALQNLVQNTGFGFATADEGNTLLSVVLNLQVRLAEVEARLEAYNLVAAN